MKKYWMDAKVDTKGSASYSHTPSVMAKSAFFYVQSVGHFRCDENYYTKREGFKSILLIYTVSGKGYARYRNKEYELNAGQVLLMDCYDYQEYSTYKNGTWEIKWMHFYGSTSQEYFDIIYEKYGAVIDFGDSTEIHNILDKILKMSGTSSPLPETNISMLIMQLLTSLALGGGNSCCSYHAKVISDYVKLALEFVEENYKRSISLSDMAVHCCCSEYHFSRLFKRDTGFSPYEYIVKYRINKAKYLLKNTDKTVENIAECVGFASNSNFIRTFGELEGMTPLKYRKYWE